MIEGVVNASYEPMATPGSLPRDTAALPGPDQSNESRWRPSGAAESARSVAPQLVGSQTGVSGSLPTTEHLQQAGKDRAAQLPDDATPGKILKSQSNVAIALSCTPTP